MRPARTAARDASNILDYTVLRNLRALSTRELAGAQGATGSVTPKRSVGEMDETGASLCSPAGREDSRIKRSQSRLSPVERKVSLGTDPPAGRKRQPGSRAPV